jgi:hypothetical protein
VRKGLIYSICVYQSTAISALTCPESRVFGNFAYWQAVVSQNPRLPGSTAVGTKPLFHWAQDRGRKNGEEFGAIFT